MRPYIVLLEKNSPSVDLCIVFDFQRSINSVHLLFTVNFGPSDHVKWFLNKWLSQNTTKCWPWIFFFKSPLSCNKLGWFVYNQPLFLTITFLFSLQEVNIELVGNYFIWFLTDLYVLGGHLHDLTILRKCLSLSLWVCLYVTFLYGHSISRMMHII